jgi:hypothetical protein
MELGYFMRFQSLVLPGISAVVVGGLVIGVNAATNPRSTSPSEVVAQRATQEAHPSATANRSNADATLQDMPCSYDATPDLAKADPRTIAIVSQNPVAQAVPGRVTRSVAIAMARRMSDAPVDVAKVADAAAVLVPAARVGMTNQLVHPNRCLWVVTVQASYTPRSGPRGAELRALPWFTASLDAASGQGQGISAGPDAPNVLTGHLPPP